MKELAEKDNYNLVLQKGTAYINYFQEADPDSDLGIIWKRVDFDAHVVKTEKDVEKALLEDDTKVYFGSEINSVVNMDAVPCNISTESENYFEVSIAWALQKNSPYRLLLNYQLTKIKEGGQISRLMDMYTSKYKTSCPEDPAKPIELGNYLEFNVNFSDEYNLII